MQYEDRYTDDSHGMAEPKSQPPPLPRFQVERLEEGHVEVEHPHPEVAAAIDREDAVMTRSEYERYQLEQETELSRFIQDMEDGKDEMVRFTSSASHLITLLTVEAARNPPLARVLDACCAYLDAGFLALANQLDTRPSDFFETLATFRRARLARARSAGMPSP